MQKHAPALPTMSPRGAPPSHAQSNVPKAIALMCLATALFTGIDATGKYLITVAGLPATQVVWVRFIGQLAAIVAALGLFAVPRLLRSAKPMHQLARSLLLLAATAFNFMALKYLRLDQTNTINFLTPLTVALLAGPLLGEWVGWRRFLAILVGFSGIVVAMRPGFAAFEPAFLLSLCCMLAYALFTLMTRHLAAHDNSEVTLFYSLLAGAVLVAPFAVADWVWPETRLIWVLVVTLGIWGALGHWIFIVAFRQAPASTLAPFTYISLLTHSAAGFLVFGHVPDAWTLGGAVIVIASGVYLWHRERVRAGEAVAPDPVAARGAVPGG